MKKFSLIITTTALLLSTANTFASINKNVYFLKGAPEAGTYIKSVEATSNIPFNKSYDELNQKQKSLVKAKYNHLGLNTIPPFPKKGLQAIYRPLVKANKTFGANEKVLINANINSDGVVSKVSFVNKQNDEFTNYVNDALLATKFTPASCDGVSCEMNFPIEISFQ